MLPAVPKLPPTLAAVLTVLSGALGALASQLPAPWSYVDIAALGALAALGATGTVSALTAHGQRVARHLAAHREGGA